MSFKIGVLKNLASKFHRKTPGLESLFNKVALIKLQALRPATLLKRDFNPDVLTSEIG